MKRLVNVILVLVILVLLALGLRDVFGYVKVNKENTSLRELAVKIPREGQGIDPNDPFYRMIDFEQLQSINPEIVGWIYVPGTGIDYPVLVGDTDTEYLRMDYNGAYSIYGTIFGFADADIVFDEHVCLFGHNTTNGLMFGDVRNYLNQDWANEHTKMYFYTPERVKECTFFSAFTCYMNDELFSAMSLSSDELEELVSSVKSRSVVTVENMPADASQVYTLSTCNGFNTPYRCLSNFLVTRERYVLE